MLAGGCGQPVITFDTLIIGGDFPSWTCCLQSEWQSEALGRVPACLELKCVLMRIKTQEKGMNL